MNNPLNELMSEYNIQTQSEALIALKEIVQKITLLGLWRGKFFEHASFYGGTALRLLYGLRRFSEDLDFSLLKPDADFCLKEYFSAVKRELLAYGINAEIQEKERHSSIDSAFVKANTAQHFMQSKIDEGLVKNIPKNQLIKIKFEVDINPPGEFRTESKFILDPIPFGVVTYTPDNLFAGKMHAVLCRAWGVRIKGRDWYDLVWFIRQNIPLNLAHLTERLKQSGHYIANEVIKEAEFQELLRERITKVDFTKAKEDVLPFIANPEELQVWSTRFFEEIVSRIKIIV